MPPVTRKLAALETYLLERALAHEPLTPLEMQQVADVIAALLPFVAAMESREIPFQFRLIDGTRPVFRVIDGGVA